MNRMVTRRGGGDSREFYLPLIDAIRNGDWASVERIHDSDEEVVRASITFNSDTALMLAVNEYRQKIDFVQNLINLLGEEDYLAWQNKDGNTALHEAVIAGYVEAAKLLVRRDRSLLLIPNCDDYLPLHSAVESGQREILYFFLGIDDMYNDLLDFESHMFMLLAIDCRLFDVALYFRRKQRLALSKEHTVVDEIKKERKKQTVSLLETIAIMPSAFSSGTNLNVWERFIYDRVPLDYKNFEHTRDDVENPTGIFRAPTAHAHDHVENGAESSQAPDDMEKQVQNLQEPTIGCCCQFFSEVLRKLHAIDLWRLLKFIVPHVKQVQDKKSIHSYAPNLVKELCCELKDSSESSETPKSLFLFVVKLGIAEIIETILVEFPNVIDFKGENELSALHLAVIYRHNNVFNTILEQRRGEFFRLITEVDTNKCSALHLAVMYRNEKIFNIIIQQKGLPRELLWEEDHRGNNILHMVGQMPYQPQLEVVSGAVLQMQHELQWYKGLEKLVPKRARVAMNENGMTPAMVFEKEHRPMIKSEEQWVVSMAGACLVATTIIGTIAFAASIQAPGGNNGEGRPILYEKTAFKIFAASNALALYSAISTFLIFLSIFTTRYRSIDFLYALPRRLIIGHIALFFSITSTIVAFDSALYLMFSQATQYVILTPMIIASCIPAFLFAFFQFQVLLNMIKTTYGRSMFSALNKK